MYQLKLDEAIAKNICDFGTTTYRNDYRHYDLPRLKIDPYLLKNRENMYKRCAIVDQVINTKDPHGQCESCELPEWLRPNSKKIAECCVKIQPLHITAEQHRGIKENGIGKCEKTKVNRFFQYSMSSTYPELYNSMTGKHVCDETKRISALRCYI